ncbi:MAG: RNA polymerase sigma factor [Ilumatobacteraceae bacterium]
MSLPPFEAVLDEHGPTVLRVLHRLLGRVDADDAWQETFLSALRAYPRLRADSDVRAWLMTIAHRKAIDRFRSRSRQPLLPGDVDDLTGPPGADGHDDELWGRVRALPTKQRLAVGYRFGADLSYADLAALLECSEPAARRSVHEGLRTLRHQFADRSNRGTNP